MGTLIPADTPGNMELAISSATVPELGLSGPHMVDSMKPPVKPRYHLLADDVSTTLWPNDCEQTIAARRIIALRRSFIESTFRRWFIVLNATKYTMDGRAPHVRDALGRSELLL